MRFEKLFRGSLILVCLSWLFSGCQAAPPRNTADAELLIGPEVMPDNWKVMEIYDELSPREGAQSGAAIVFKAQNTPFHAVSSQYIYHYRSQSQASRHYLHIAETGCGDNREPGHTSAWPSPDTFTYSPENATQWCFGCTRRAAGLLSGPFCIYQAQYQEYVVDYSVAVGVDEEQFISMGEIVNVIQAIDQHIAAKLR